MTTHSTPRPIRHPAARLRFAPGTAWFPAALLLALLACVLAAAPARAQGVPDDEVVYLDAAGFIHVYDPRSSMGGALVTWASPVGGYVRFTLADLNNDGDQEIAALRRMSGAGVLDIYDPVVSSGDVDPGQTFGGIPWLQLASLPLPDAPALIAAGNLDGASPGPELLVSYGDDYSAAPERPIPDQNWLIFRQTGVADGRDWRADPLPLRVPSVRNAWTDVALGEMDQRDHDEIALVDAGNGVLAIFRVDGSLDGPGGNSTAQIYINASETRPWRAVDMGRWRAEPAVQLAAVREVRDLPPNALPDFLVFTYSTDPADPIASVYRESFAPSPQTVFFGDLNADGYADAVLLRNVEAGSTQPRLFTRSRRGDFIEDRLTGAHIYRAGAAGDTDADGKDEIILISDTNIRIFTEPDLSDASTDEPRTTDGANVAAGDLDRAGFTRLAELQVTPQTIRHTAAAGSTATIFAVSVINATDERELPIYWTLPGDPAWVAVEANSGFTPAVLNVRFDPAGLAPGAYSAQLQVWSSDPIVYPQPRIVELTFTVTPGLYFRPAALTFVHYPCARPFPAQTHTVEIVADAPLTYTASILDVPEAQAAAGPAAADVVWPSSVDWASASSPAGIAPETITVTVDFAQWNPTEHPNPDTAVLVAVAHQGDQTLIRRLPITLFCASERAVLPQISR